MRPHTFAALVIFLFFLKRPNERRNRFYMEIEAKKNNRSPKIHEYDLDVLEQTPELLKLRIGRMWTCELEVRPEKIGSDKFIIKHNHTEYVTEEFIVQAPRDLSGEYRSHALFTGFETYDFTRDDLEIKCDYNGMSFQVKKLL